MKQEEEKREGVTVEEEPNRDQTRSATTEVR